MGSLCVLMCGWMFVSKYQPFPDLATSDKNISSNEVMEATMIKTAAVWINLFMIFSLPVQSNVFQDFSEINPEMCILV